MLVKHKLLLGNSLMMYMILLNVNTEYRLLFILTPYLKREDKDKFTKNQIIYCTDRYTTQA